MGDGYLLVGEGRRELEGEVLLVLLEYGRDVCLEDLFSQEWVVLHQQSEQFDQVSYLEDVLLGSISVSHESHDLLQQFEEEGLDLLE